VEYQPDISVTEIEKFWAEGCDAIQSSTGAGPQPETSKTTSDSVGIDLPGVGVMRPEVSPLELRSGRENAVGEVPRRDLAGGVDPQLRGFLDGERLDFSGTPYEHRERLFSELVLAAKSLAEAQIEPADETEPAFCTECVAEERDGVMEHETECRAGRVLEVIAEIGVLKPSPCAAAEGGAQ
jgi:hypothetical protein